MDDTTTFIYVLAIVFSIAGIFVLPFLAHRNGMRAAEHVVEAQYHVIDDEYVAGFKQQLEPDKRSRVDELVAQVHARGHTLRKGHILWIMQVIDGRAQAGMVPALSPPSGQPYTPALDEQAPALRRFFELSLNGELVEAYRHVREAAEAGSPMAMVLYGGALLEEKVPGRYDPASGLTWLERAVSATGGTFGRDSLGHALLRHGASMQDRERGLSLMEQEMRDSKGGVALQWDLVQIYEEGLHGIAPNREKALEWATHGAGTAKRLAWRLGIGRSAVDEMLQRLEIVREVRKEIESTPGVVLQKRVREHLARARDRDG